MSPAWDVSSTTGRFEKICRDPAEKLYPMAARLPKIALDFHAAFNEPPGSRISAQ
jgi:hypothetical protein